VTGLVDIQGISLILTNKCNAACRHCGFACGPDKNETMTVKDALFYIEAAKSFPSLKMVCLTGGEPFLYYDRVVDIMAHAFKQGLTSEIVTNCFWAENYEISFGKLKRLRELGLVNFVTSLDDFHLEYIPVDNIKNAIRVAVDIGLKVTVKTLEYDNCRIKSEDVPELLELSQETKNLSLQKIEPVSEGRFKLLKSNKMVKDLEKRAIRKQDVNLSGGCSKIIKFPAVNPMGELYPCCGFGDGSRFSGKYPDSNFYELLSMMQNNLLFNLLATLGPHGVLKLAEQYFTEPIRDSYDNPCELCNFLFSTETTREAVCKAMKYLMEQ
jgi:MoaA/NifB/PqqE/SkfB family radical SAM enzyme